MRLKESEENFRQDDDQSMPIWQELDTIIDAVICSLPEPDLRVVELRFILQQILEVVKGQEIRVDRQGIFGLVNHLAGLVIRSYNANTLTIPFDFADQIPEKEMENASQIAWNITNLTGIKVPASEIGLIASHFAAMNLRLLEVESSDNGKTN